ncbi:T9SS type A sorting domain-containing protein [Flammeovirga pacifica]|uniref:Uncharacterized protein n=1 Tax=Flammeovirga pacifica TaxID=915059 RepID=A0A1S1YSS4_FLAPC|nr:T9SS type A sorting domain-containing protein [Flammeovirga pacifica]OHX64077.1 hypothetical protein NH26_20945 [Flammeovirga pacifica]
MKKIITSILLLLSATFLLANDNLIKNPGFEEAITSEWEMTVNSSADPDFPPTWSIITHKENGTNAYQFSIPDNDANANLSISNIQLKDGAFTNLAEALTEETTYTISADLYGNEGHQVRYLLRWDNGAANAVSSSNIVISSTSQNYEAKLTMPAGATKFSIFIQVGGNVGDVVIDNVSLVQEQTKTDEELAQEALDNLVITYNNIDPQDGNGIMYSIEELPATGLNETMVSWTSSNQSVIDNTGKVNRSTQTETVKLTATVTKNTTSLTKEFTISVLPLTINGNYIVLNNDFTDGLIHWDVNYNTGNVAADDFTFSNVTHKENGTQAAQLNITNGGVSLPNLAIRSQIFPFNELSSEVKYFRMEMDAYASTDMSLRFQFQGKDIDNKNVNVVTQTFTIGEENEKLIDVIEVPAGIQAFRFLAQVGSNTGDIVIDNVIVTEVNKDESDVYVSKKNLELQLVGEDKEHDINNSFPLQSSDDTYGTSISWFVEDNDALVINNGTAEVQKVTVNTDLALIATITKGDISTTKTFNIRIKANQEAQLEEVVNSLKVQFADGDTEESVSQDIVLATSGKYSTTIEWVSEHTQITKEGVVTILDNSVVGDLIATVTLGDLSDTKTFTLTTVQSDAGKLNEALSALEVVFEEGDNAGAVSQNVTLVSEGLHETVVTWVSTHTNITNDGVVTLTTQKVSGDLTATVTLGDLSEDKVFTLTTSIDHQAQLDEAVNALEITYAEGEDAMSVKNDLTLAIEGLHSSTITWTSSNEEVVTVNGVVNQAITDQEVILTATVAIGDLSEEKIFTVKVLNNAQEKFDEAVASLEVIFNEGDNADAVSQNVTLVSEGLHETVVTWVSTHTNITNDGVVSLTTQKVSGDLTATVTLGDLSEDKVFTLTTSIDHQAQLDEAVNALEITYAEDEDAMTVKNDLTLANEGLHSSSITWISSNEEVVSANGMVNQASTDQEVTLTATVSIENQSEEKVFTIKVLNNAQELLDDATDALEVIFAEGESATTVKSDIELINVIGEVSIVWESSNTEVVTIDGKVMPSLEDVNVTLTATLSINDLSTTKVFDIVVLKDDAPTSIDDNLIVIKAYPNPTTDVLNITTSSKVKTIIIIDLMGRELIKLNQTAGTTSWKVDVSNLNRGQYILKAETQSIKFIKK